MFAWRKPPLGTAIVVAPEVIPVGTLVVVYDRQPTGGGWWKPGRVVASPDATGALVSFRASRRRTTSVRFPLDRIRQAVSPALCADVERLLLEGEA